MTQPEFSRCCEALQAAVDSLSVPEHYAVRKAEHYIAEFEHDELPLVMVVTVTDRSYRGGPVYHARAKAYGTITVGEYAVDEDLDYILDWIVVWMREHSWPIEFFVDDAVYWSPSRDTPTVSRRADIGVIRDDADEDTG